MISHIEPDATEDEPGVTRQDKLHRISTLSSDLIDLEAVVNVRRQEHNAAKRALDEASEQAESTRNEIWDLAKELDIIPSYV